MPWPRPHSGDSSSPPIAVGQVQPVEPRRAASSTDARLDAPLEAIRLDGRSSLQASCEPARAARITPARPPMSSSGRARRDRVEGVDEDREAVLRDGIVERETAIEHRPADARGPVVEAAVRAPATERACRRAPSASRAHLRHRSPPQGGRGTSRSRRFRRRANRAGAVHDAVLEPNGSTWSPSQRARPSCHNASRMERRADVDRRFDDIACADGAGTGAAAGPPPARSGEGSVIMVAPGASHGRAGSRPASRGPCDRALLRLAVSCSPRTPASAGARTAQRVWPKLAPQARPSAAAMPGRSHAVGGEPPTQIAGRIQRRRDGDRELRLNGPEPVPRQVHDSASARCASPSWRFTFNAYGVRRLQGPGEQRHAGRSPGDER